jgi:hypothetical protein
MRRAEREAERAERDQGQRPDEERPRTVTTDEPPREREPGDHAGGKGRHQQADRRGTGARRVGDRRRDGDDDAVAGRVECAERQQ